jgi:hypothetical protein
MLDSFLSDGDQVFLHQFFFSGTYPLALQLGIVNGLSVIAIVLLRSAQYRSPETGLQFSRRFSWLVVFANFFLIFNKDHRFIDFLM